MSALELTVTERIDGQQAQRLASELRRHLEVDGPYTLVRKEGGGAGASEIPQYIQLLGGVTPWLVLLYGAKVFLDGAKVFFKSYLEALGPLAAQATRDGLAALFKKQEVKPLAEVATALADARKASSGRIEIVIGLDIPDSRYGTALHITQDSAEEIALPLAVFVTRANELSTIMKAEVEAGRRPVGRAVITQEKDGGLTVRWLTTESAHEKRIP